QETSWLTSLSLYGLIYPIRYKQMRRNKNMFKLFSKNAAITTKELENDLSEKTILDVRTPGEYRTGHISNAKNIPLDKIAAYAGPTETPVYVICQSGMRSKRAAGILK